MLGWVVSVVGQGYVSLGMGTLWALAGGFLAMDYAVSTYLLSFYYETGTMLSAGDTVGRCGSCP